MSTELPGAAEKLSVSMKLRGGVRCNSASTLVHNTRGRSADEPVRARRASVVIRCAATGPFGEARS